MASPKKSVRIGAFFHTGEESGFDGGIGEEPEGSPFRPLKPATP